MILVTGATGFLGSYLCKHLRDCGLPYIGISSATESAEDSIFKVNLKNPETFRVLDRFDIDTVIHLAGLIPAKLESPTGNEYFQVNSIGTLNLLNYFKGKSLKKVVFATTLYEVIEHEMMPIKESMGRNFSLVGDHALYVFSKIAATDILRHFSAVDNFHLTILRFTGLIGLGRQQGHWSDGVFHKSAFETFYENALLGKPLEVWGNGDVRRDSLYVLDAVSAILASLRTDFENNLTFNIASGVGSTVLEEVNAFQRFFPSSSIVSVKSKTTSTKEYYFDISLPKSVLKWEPKFDYSEMIKDYHQKKVRDHENKKD